KGRGRPPLPAPDLAKAVLIQQYFDVANRTTAGLVECIKNFEMKEGLVITRDYEASQKVEEFEIKFVPLWKWLIEQNEE
ncbi:hypothetical protein AKJ64_00775, partial [candidate division MSBL1 archaeon SCGC-AAA259E17]